MATWDRHTNFISRSRKRGTRWVPDWESDVHVNEHSFGLKKTGFGFSKRGMLSCTIYDKTREIKQSGKDKNRQAFLERKERVFGTEVQRKRVKFSLQVS